MIECALRISWECEIVLNELYEATKRTTILLYHSMRDGVNTNIKTTIRDNSLMSHEREKKTVKCLRSYFMKITLVKWLVKYMTCWTNREMWNLLLLMCVCMCVPYRTYVNKFWFECGKCETNRISGVDICWSIILGVEKMTKSSSVPTAITISIACSASRRFHLCLIG